MLEGVFVIIDVVVEIVGVGKEIVFQGKHISRGDIFFGQENPFGLADHEHILLGKAQVFTVLVAQVGIGIAVADNFKGALTPDGAVVGGNDESAFLLGYQF